MRDTRFPALVYDKQHDFKIQNSVNRTPVRCIFVFAEHPRSPMAACGMIRAGLGTSQSISLSLDRAVGREGP